MVRIIRMLGMPRILRMIGSSKTISEESYVSIHRKVEGRKDLLDGWCHA
jgi:hypothetical protein